MHVEIDVSEAVRFDDRVSIMGVTTPDGRYKKNVCLTPHEKRKINDFKGEVDNVHALLIYILLKTDMNRYTSIKICSDIGKGNLRNLLRQLFCKSPYYMDLERNKMIKIAPVGTCFVDKYVKNVRETKVMWGYKVTKKLLEPMICKLNEPRVKVKKRKNKSRHKPIIHRK